MGRSPRRKVEPEEKGMGIPQRSKTWGWDLAMPEGWRVRNTTLRRTRHSAEFRQTANDTSQGGKSSLRHVLRRQQHDTVRCQHMLVRKMSYMMGVPAKHPGGNSKMSKTNAIQKNTFPKHQGSHTSRFWGYTLGGFVDLQRNNHS